MSFLDGALSSPSHTALDNADAFVPQFVEPMQMSAVVDPLLYQSEEMEELFGDDRDQEGPKTYEGVASDHTSDGVVTPEVRNPLEYDEDDQPQEEIVQRKEADVSIPNIPVPHSSSGETWVIRMPSYVAVDPKPFHPDTYMGPEHENEDSSQAQTIREKSMSIKLKVENTVRWRWIKDTSGKDQRQSNSRIIRWSDGTLSLRLGKELFDINQAIDNSGGISRQSIGGLQMSQNGSPSSSQISPSKSQGLTYLVAQHKHSQVLQAEAVITGHMTIQPTGMQSDTHRMLVRAVGQKHNKVARLRMAPDPIVDPEREKLELMKQSAKKAKKKAEEDEFGGRKRRTGSARKRAGHDVWSDDEEEFAASEGENETGTEGTPKRKRKAADPEDKKKIGEYQEDDFLVADSTDEDGEDDAGRIKAHKARDGEPEEDPLDVLDEKIRRQEEERRRNRNSGGGADGDESDDEGKGGEEEMDVESEEGEEDFRVRRAGSSGRKRRAIDLEEEDDE